MSGDLFETGDVACAGCTACCVKGSIITVFADIDGDIRRFKKSTVVPNTRGTVRELHRTLDGSCAYLENSKCSIYEDRPDMCRQFDCRLLVVLNRECKPFGRFLMSPEVMQAGMDREDSLTESNRAALAKMRDALNKAEGSPLSAHPLTGILPL